MKRMRFSISLFIVMFAFAFTMPACKTLDSVLNKESSPKAKPKEVKKEKKAAPKAQTPKKAKSEAPKAKVEAKKEAKKEGEQVEAPIYEPPLRGSPKSRVGGGTR